LPPTLPLILTGTTTSTSCYFFFFGLALFLDKRNFWNKIVDRQFGYVCSFYRCQFDPVNGGEMTQLEYHNFLKPEAAF